MISAHEFNKFYGFLIKYLCNENIFIRVPLVAHIHENHSTLNHNNFFCFLSESNESYFGAYKIGSTVIIPKVSWTTYMLAMTV